MNPAASPQPNPVPRSRPLAGPLRPRVPDGNYPFLNHRTWAEILADAGRSDAHA